MRTSFSSRRASFLPAYRQNAALQLVVALGAMFILYKIVWIFGLAANQMKSEDATYLFSSLVALPPVQKFGSFFWTILTYGWFHNSFWLWLSNMVWLYVFGNIVQHLVGHKQVIPIFFYGLLLGGLFCLGIQLLPYPVLQLHYPDVAGQAGVMTAQAGITALAVACLTISPKYRFYLKENLGIQLWIVAVIYFFLSMSTFRVPYLLLTAGGALAGFGYVRLLKSGYHPGGWMYRVADKFSNKEEDLRYIKGPRRGEVQPQDGFGQNRIDAILEKIHQKGYNSLTKAEKDLLLQASKGGDREL